jgi:hypothetical protein
MTVMTVRKHSETIAALSQQKSTREKKIHELHALEREYCTCLKTCLTAQLGELERKQIVCTNGPVYAPGEALPLLGQARMPEPGLGNN